MCATYGYDVQGQLTTAEVGGTSYTYTYDTAGNILTSSDGEETHEYSYGNSEWRDLLTAYDGLEISYDGCGNPVSYYDGSTFTWTQGRRLAGYANGDTDISYAYDMAGVRSSKTENGTEYRFTTLSGLVTRQEWDGNSIDFVYDENNQPLAMKYNNTLYYYILNVQGDVIALADQNGNLIAKYSYDPWGKLLKVTPNGWLEEQNAYYLKVAEANPLRYRGYYYDSETGFYYLQSRYYDPAIGRFINADSYASTDAAGLLSTNMFAYCENNPISRFDPTGELFWDVVDCFMAALSINDFIQNPSWENFGWAALDIVSLLPVVPSLSYVRRGIQAADTLSDARKATNVGWKVGDDISNLTRAGNAPSWSTVRQRYWKNEAFYNFKEYSPENLLRMSQGKAPLIQHPGNGKMYSMELHHPDGRKGDDLFNFVPVTPWKHAEIDKYRHFIP